MAAVGAGCFELSCRASSSCPAGCLELVGGQSFESAGAYAVEMSIDWRFRVTVLDWRFRTADGKKHKHICCNEHPCAFREQGHERLGRDGPTCNEASAFPPDLVTFLNDHIMNETCAHRRNDDVKA